MKQMLLLLDRLVKGLVQVTLAAAAVCLLLIMSIGTIDALTLNLLDWPLPAALEISEVLLAITVFMAFAYAQRSRQHIRVELLIDKTPRMIRHLSMFLSFAFGAVLFAAIFWRTYELAMTSYRIDETANAALSFPIYPAKFLAAAGAFIAMLEFLRQLAWLLLGVEDDRKNTNLSDQEVL